MFICFFFFLGINQGKCLPSKYLHHKKPEFCQKKSKKGHTPEHRNYTKEVTNEKDDEEKKTEKII